MFIEALEGGHYAPSSGSRAKPLVGLGVEAAKTFQLYSTCYEVEDSWKYGNKEEWQKSNSKHFCKINDHDYYQLSTGKYLNFVCFYFDSKAELKVS